MFWPCWHGKTSGKILLRLWANYSQDMRVPLKPAVRCGGLQKVFMLFNWLHTTLKANRAFSMSLVCSVWMQLGETQQNQEVKGKNSAKSFWIVGFGNQILIFCLFFSLLTSENQLLYSLIQLLLSVMKIKL